MCEDCGLPYDEPGWIEAIVPDEVWAMITPSEHKRAGILCITCIARRCVEAGLEDVPVLLCGTEPLRAVTTHRALWAKDKLRTRWERRRNRWHAYWWHKRRNTKRALLTTIDGLEAEKWRLHQALEQITDRQTVELVMNDKLEFKETPTWLKNQRAKRSER